VFALHQATRFLTRARAEKFASPSPPAHFSSPPAAGLGLGWVREAAALFKY
jgi:hypothetical protein